MKSYTSLGKAVFAVWLSFLLSGCLTGSGSGSGWSDAGATATTVHGISLAITSPTSSSTMDTTDDSVTLGGTAGSEQGISEVSWSNDRGGQGNASGTDNWQTAAIALELGQNTITITARNGDGQSHSRQITIYRESGEPGSATLSWDAPTRRTDGTPLDNLAGYKIFYGRMSGIYDYVIEIDNPGVQTYVVDGLVSGDWYFALAAYDTDGIESDRSNEVLRDIS